MRRFAELINELTSTTKTNDKRDALVRYLGDAPDEDNVWLIALFTGRRPRRVVKTTLMKEWCMEISDIPQWLFDESYQTVGDLGEAISLMLPDAEQEHTDISLNELMHRLQQLQNADDEEKKAFVTDYWQRLSRMECFVFNKLITGGFRIGVSQNIVIQALARHADKEIQEIAHMISGNWEPFTTTYEELIENSDIATDSSKPYPFFLAYPVEGGVESLGEPNEWQAEWKWDGIRGQLIRREGSVYLWSRGEELITEKFPEIESLLPLLPDGIVLDGEVLSYRDDMPLSFQYLQTRIGRKNVSKKQLEQAPVVFMAYDVLEWEGKDMRGEPLAHRRELLKQLTDNTESPHLIISEEVSFDSWETLHELMPTARERGCEGFMIKRLSSPYQAGRRRGDWWKWKVEPLTIDAVLIYAQKGHGKRSNLYTDYTFAVKDGDKLVPFAKAYSGLTDKEIREVDRFIKKNITEQFGPVRTVKPELVFEIAFEGIAKSGRHKSGVAVRFPRMHRWRQDKKPGDINTLDDLQEMLEQYGKM